MDEKGPIEKIEAKEASFSPPFSLSLVALFFFVFFGVYALIFLLSLFYSGTITRVINTYIPEDAFSPTVITLIILGGFVLHAAASAGILMMWKLRKKGYFLFATSCILLTTYQLTQHQVSVIITAVYIGAVILFGIFYRKMR
ncbi:MAG TPA: hypothetical protein VLR52_05815 [Bacteroidales bacterium]|nr:hypothetical protein [Bacteroidales bacterium]